MFHVSGNDQASLRKVIEEWSGMAPGGFAQDAVFLGITDVAKHKVVAVVAYNARYGHFLNMHVATDGSKRWLNRPVLMLVFGYAFDFFQVKRINALVSASNIPAQIMALKLGFRFEGALACGADDGTDGVLFGMLKHECPWRHKED